MTLNHEANSWVTVGGRGLPENIKLSHVIDSSEFNGTAFLNEDPVQSSPLFHDEILYFVTRENSLAAWDVEDNKIIFNLKFIMAPAQRGMALYQDDIRNETTLYFIVSSYLVAVNALTGKLKKDFGTNGYLKVGYGTAAPIVFDNTVIISTNQPSSILAVNFGTPTLLY